MEENKEQNKIFSAKSDLTLDEFKKIFKCVPNFYWANVGHTSLNLLLAILIFSVIYQCNITETIILYSIIFSFAANLRKPL
jgi:hypothetical protein